MLIQVNPDGSGSITLHSYSVGGISAGHMNGGSKPEQIEQEQAEDVKSRWSEDQAKLRQMETDALAFSLGPVTKLSGEAGTNKEKWSGYKAVYAFDDINKITLPKSGDNSDWLGIPAYDFVFTPGSPAKLEIIADIEEQTDLVVGKEPLTEGAEATEDETIDYDNAKAALMTLCAGMRETLIITVNGTVVDSNADIVNPKSNNTFILADFELDKILTNPELEKLANEFQGSLPDQTINTSGMLLQNPMEPVIVTFQ